MTPIEGKPMDFRLHHVGLVVADLEAAAAEYTGRFGYAVKSPVIEDPVQTARGQFLQLTGDSSYLELLGPVGSDSKLTTAFEKGRRLNHLCYAVSDIEAACASLRRQGMFLLQTPVESIAFRPRRLAWLMGRDGVPIELVEDGEEWWA
jgi:methylmalonyl-CoA/ethylmalonyl-CoA epimerase